MDPAFDNAHADHVVESLQSHLLDLLSFKKVKQDVLCLGVSRVIRPLVPEEHHQRLRPDRFVSAFKLTNGDVVLHSEFEYVEDMRIKGSAQHEVVRALLGV